MDEIAAMQFLKHRDDFDTLYQQLRGQQSNFSLLAEPTLNVTCRFWHHPSPHCYRSGLGVRQLASVDGVSKAVAWSAATFRKMARSWKGAYQC